MENRAGFWRQNFSGDLAYKSFVPAPLPPNPVVELSNEGINLLMQCHTALGALNAVARRVPSLKVFISMYVRKEAVLSSQIEGTQCTLEDLLDPFAEETSNLDLDEVVNYVAATDYALKRLRELPLCNRFLRESHKVLVGQQRGKEKLPGEFRSSQNWIGGNGSSLKTARYIPPNVEDMLVALDNWERYIHSPENIDPLVKVALLHYQFETIHPFLDGNGRVGRLFIILFLLEKKVLTEPILYISYFLKLNQQEYYDRLTLVRKTGDFEQWICFFLEALREAAKAALESIDLLDELHKHSLEQLVSKVPTRQLDNVGKVFSYLESHPIIEITKTAQVLEMPYNSVARAVTQLQKLGILVEARKKGRSVVYAYKQYLDILNK